MKKDPGLIFRLVLLVVDACAIVLAFGLAYFMRTHLDQRPYYFAAEPENFMLSIALLVPVWLIILALFGLYSSSVLLARSRTKEVIRLFAASVVGVMTIIAYDFFAGGGLFPVRLVAVYAMITCFASLLILRSIVRLVRRQIFKNDYGTLQVLIIGDNINTKHLASYILKCPESGYRVASIVASSKRFLPDGDFEKFTSLKEALARTRADVIFQTDEKRTEYVYRQAIEFHLAYYFVPSESALSAHMGQMELIGNTPAILVRVTPLASGGARVVKRLSDLFFGGLMFLVAAIPMLIVWIILKLSDLSAPATYGGVRLSRFNRRVKIYKFRTMKPEYNGLSPEEAFEKMGKPELIKQYRDNGDFLEDDPRVSKIGKFLRKTSLDELPQLINVLKGDISLVGPRALVPGELRDYGDRSLLLSIKSGLTGLAQVSGRRDISFDERRSIDLYYIQNWSLWLDIRILFRTVGAVLFGTGAK